MFSEETTFWDAPSRLEVPLPGRLNGYSSNSLYFNRLKEFCRAFGNDPYGRRVGWALFQDKGDHKPGSVPPELQAAMIIHLGQALPPASSDRTRRLQASNLSPTSSHQASAAGGRWDCLSIWSCSEWGLPSPGVTIGTGALLPHRFTLTRHHTRRSPVSCMDLAVCFLWHFP